LLQENVFILPNTFAKFAEAGITDFEHFLSGEGNYLTYDELVSKYGVAPSNSDFSHFIRLVTKFPKEWENYDVRIRKSLPDSNSIFEISKLNLNVSKLLNSFIVVCVVK